MDLQAIQDYALEVWKAKQGEVVSLMIGLGDQLDIFTAMAGAGPVDSETLATSTGLAERPLREWLYGCAAATLIHHDAGKFVLPDEAIPVLVEEETSVFYAAGAFAMVPPDILAPTVELLRTGRGAGFDSLGAHTIEALERMAGPTFRILLPGVVLPAAGIELPQRGRIADIGCGTGVSSTILADAFPDASVVGLDPSVASYSRAMARANHRITFELDYAENLPNRGEFDFITAFDCLHDMPRPDLALQACRGALRPGGAVLVKEPRASGDFETDRRNPLLAMNYGFSLTGCLQSGLSTEDGWGLGNMGMDESTLRTVATEAGFDSVERVKVSDPAASYYVLR
jgi:SAM-dependent methyltransferase